MRPFLRLLAYLSTRHPVGVLTGMILLTILAAFPAFRALHNIENDLTQLLPKSLPASQTLLEISDSFDVRGMMLVSVELPPARVVLPRPSPLPQAAAADFDFAAAVDKEVDLSPLSAASDAEVRRGCEQYLSALREYRQLRTSHPQPFEPAQDSPLADAWEKCQSAYEAANEPLEAERAPVREVAERYIDILGERLRQSDPDHNLIQAVDYKATAEERDFLKEQARKWGVLYLDPPELDEMRRRFQPPVMRRYLASAVAGGTIQYLKEDPLKLAPLLLTRAARYRRRIAGVGGSDYALSPDGSMMIVSIRGRNPASDLAFSRQLVQFVQEQCDAVWQQLDQEIQQEARQEIVEAQAQLEEARAEFDEAAKEREEDQEAYEQAQQALEAAEQEFKQAEQRPQLLHEAREKITVAPAYQYPVVVYEDKSLRRDILLTFTLSLALILVLFIFVYRRLTVALYLGVPVFMGIVLTLGLAGLVFDRINVLSGSFAAMLVGLGVDYGIHIYNRYVIEYGRAADVKTAVANALLFSGPGIVTGALTTAAAFYGIAVTRFEALSQFGLLAGSGILILMVTLMLVMPSLLVVVGRWGQKGPRQARMFGFGLHFLARLVRRRPGLICLATALLFIATTAHFAIGVDRKFFNPNFRALRSQVNPPYEQTRKIMKTFDTNLSSMIVLTRGATAEDAIDEAAKVYRLVVEGPKAPKSDGRVVDIDTILQFLPARSAQQASKEALRKIDFDQVKEDFRRQCLHPDVRLKADFFAPFFQRLDRIAALARSGDEQLVGLSELQQSPGFKALLARFHAQSQSSRRPDGLSHLVITRLNPPSKHLDPEYFQQLKEDLEIREPQRSLTSVGMAGYELRDLLLEDFRLITGMVLGLVLLAVTLSFRAPGRSLPIGLAIGLAYGLLALAPLVVGMFWMLSLMLLLGWTLNPLNVIVVPAIIGIAIDHGIHIVHSYLERRGTEHTVVDIGRALMATSLTTIIGFGSLVFANYFGLVTLGRVAAMGIACCTVTSLVALPAFLVLFGRAAKAEVDAAATGKAGTATATATEGE